jgi:hypothetical protein
MVPAIQSDQTYILADSGGLLPNLLLKKPSLRKQEAQRIIPGLNGYKPTGLHPDPIRRSIIILSNTWRAWSSPAHHQLIGSIKPIKRDNKMCETSKLRSAVAGLTFKHGVDAIPYDYYDRMMITWQGMNNYGQQWDRYKAAAALLFTAHMDGYIHETQITPDGHKAMAWADHFLQETDVLP